MGLLSGLKKRNITDADIARLVEAEKRLLPMIGDKHISVTSVAGVGTAIAQKDLPERKFLVRFGVCSAVSGNTVTLQPCRAANDQTLTGEADVQCFAVWPYQTDPSSVTSALQLDVGSTYAFVPLRLDGENTDRGALLPVNLRSGC